MADQVIHVLHICNFILGAGWIALLAWFFYRLRECPVDYQALGSPRFVSWGFLGLFFTWKRHPISDAVLAKAVIGMRVYIVVALLMFIAEGIAIASTHP